MYGKGSNTVNELDKIKELNKQNFKFKSKTKALNREVTNDNYEGDDNDEPEDAGDQFGGKKYKTNYKKNGLLGLNYYFPWIIISYNMKLIVKWLNILDVSSREAIKFSVKQVHTGQTQIISAAQYLSRSDKVVYGRSELDSNADTTVAGSNCCILQYNGK